MRDKAGEPSDLQGKIGEALGEIGEVLAREQGSGGNDSNLLAIHGCHKSRAQSNLGLAKANIAAHQPVHRLAAFQIAQDIADSAVLILGLLPREAVDKLVEAGRISGKYGRFFKSALSCHFHQFSSNLANALFKTSAAFLPCFSAQPVKHHRIFG